MRCATVTKSFLRRAQGVLAAHYDYPLPASRIAQRPLAERGASKLLVARGTPASVTDHQFSELPALLPAGCLLVRNDSRVIRARIRARKSTGGAAEVFLQEPLGNGVWRCMIGGRRVRAGDTLTSVPPGAAADVLRREGRDAVVRLRGAVDAVAAMPLPPYIARDADARDDVDYQTVYSRAAGSVAAPTAGLHVTQRLERELAARGVQVADVTLHVGAGTFAPLGGELVGQHTMHEERACVRRDVLDVLLAQVRAGLPVVAMGTTSVRTLESAYWLGARLLRDGQSDDVGVVERLDQWEPYELMDKLGVDGLPTPTEALNGVVNSMRDVESLNIATKLLIVPSYPFQMYVTRYFCVLCASSSNLDVLQSVSTHSLLTFTSRSRHCSCWWRRSRAVGTSCAVYTTMH